MPGGILSDVFGVNGRKILDGLAEGTGREAILASLTSHVADKMEGLGEALSPSLRDNDCFMLGDLLGEHDALVARIASYTEKIDEQMTPWEEQLRLLTAIPGIDRTRRPASRSRPAFPDRRGRKTMRRPPTRRDPSPHTDGTR